MGERVAQAVRRDRRDCSLRSTVGIRASPKGVVGLWVGGDYVFYKKFWGTAFVIVLPVALLPWVVHFVIKSIVECFQPEPGEE